MTEGNFLQQKRRSPAGLGVVIAGHAAVLAALILATSEYRVIDRSPIYVRNIPDTPPPPPEPKADKVPEKKATQQPEVLRFERPLVDLPLPPQVPVRGEDQVVLPDPRSNPGPDTAEQPPKQPEPAPPVRVEARIDARSSLQPPYPAAEQREGREGSVTVRVTIGPDGRVLAVEKVRATSDGFWRATERQALRHWRFKPAMLDGQPVAGTATMTVHFRMDD